MERISRSECAGVPAIRGIQIHRSARSDNTVGDSSREPAKPQKEGEKDLKFQYAALYSDEFAKHYGVADEENSGKFLTLRQLVHRGMVHEVWCVISGNTKAPRQVGMWESIELKLAYDANFKPKVAEPIHSGNGHDLEQPWIGRSLRIGCINASRGPGCFLESLIALVRADEHERRGSVSRAVLPRVRGLRSGREVFASVQQFVWRGESTTSNIRMRPPLSSRIATRLFV